MPRILEAKDNLQDLLQIKNSTDTAVDIYFYGDIVSSWWGAWEKEDQYPDAVKDFLNNANGRDVNVHINSGGGSVFAGIAIYNMLANYSGTVTVYIDGMAASIASVIALAGDKTIMRTGSVMMIHKPMLVMCGGFNTDELEKATTDLQEIEKAVMQVYEKHKKETCSIETIAEKVKAATYMGTEEACEIFNIEKDDALEAVACESDFIAKYVPIPPQYAQELRHKNDDIKNQLMHEYEILKLGGFQK